jgi:hypothetical protein
MPGSTIANQLTTTTPVVNIYDTTTICPNAVSLANATSYYGSGRVTIPNAGGGGTGAVSEYLIPARGLKRLYLYELLVPVWFPNI